MANLDKMEPVNVRSPLTGRMTIKDFAIWPDGEIRCVLVGPNQVLRKNDRGQVVVAPEWAEYGIVTLAQACRQDSRSQVQQSGYRIFAERYRAGRSGKVAPLDPRWIPELAQERQATAQKRQTTGLWEAPAFDPADGPSGPEANLGLDPLPESQAQKRGPGRPKKESYL